MAIAQTGAIYKSLIFDNKTSREFGVYITGEAVYNAPEREVEMISIPGRNGALALDKGRFENIEVTYPAGIFADTEADFAQAVSEFRNFLCSKKGYCRLSDDYNPSEYRMAVYKSGLEVTPAQLKAGEFDITFECQPQRFLTSGETAVSVANNGTLLNPTLFDAKPLLEVKGYGNIIFGGYSITIRDEEIGDVTLMEARRNLSNDGSVAISGTFNKAILDSGDPITCHPVTVTLLFKDSQNRISYAEGAESGNGTGSTVISNLAAGSFVSTTTITGITFTAGTQVNPRVHTTTLTVRLSDNSIVTTAYSVYFQYSVATGGLAIVLRPATGSTWIGRNVTIETQGITAVSSASILGDPTYIDCDMGEAYKIENDSPVSLNRYIDLGSELPVMSVGGTEITYDNTITDLKIIPRWWKL